MDLQSYFAYLASFLVVGSFVFIDLIAATTNALNGALLAQRPDYYRGKQWSIVGILILAIFGGIGGGISRDVLLNKIPGALTNPWYLILCVLAGYRRNADLLQGRAEVPGDVLPVHDRLLAALVRGDRRAAGLAAGLPDIAAIFIGDCRPDRRPVPDRYHRRQIGQAVRARRVVRRHGRADLRRLSDLRQVLWANPYGRRP